MIPVKFVRDFKFIVVKTFCDSRVSELWNLETKTGQDWAKIVKNQILLRVLLLPWSYFKKCLHVDLTIKLPLSATS